MSYFDDYFVLKSLFDQKLTTIKLPDSKSEILNIPFQSKNYKILPEEEEYTCDDHYRYFVSQVESNRELFSPPLNEILHVLDSEVSENRSFKYPMFKGAPSLKASGIIILIHGLNEKSWDKYYPWAQKLLELTHKAVLLFPIAFHMNRAPDR